MSDIHQQILALGLEFTPDQIRGSAALFAAERVHLRLEAGWRPLAIPPA